MRILFLTDAWPPQLNGVAIGSQAHVDRLRATGHEVRVISPDQFRTVPCPSYPDIRLALAGRRAIARTIAAFRPEAIHVNTEGPVGLAGVLACRKLHLAFTTSYRSKFPEYINLRYGVPLGWTYRFLRWFHNSGALCMVPTESLREQLHAQGFRNLRVWTRGVDAERFRPDVPPLLSGLARPVFLYVGRLAVEKNIEAFLALDLPGSKVIAGDGPYRAELERRFPQARFVGARFGEELAGVYTSADVLVFPSLTDTFGNVIIEALASGVPVAAYPVTGPKDILTDPRVGVLDTDLGGAATRALGLSGEACRAHALTFSWEASLAQFLENLRLASRGPMVDAKAA